MGSWWDIEVKAMKMKILPAFIGSHEPSTMKIDRPCMIDQFGYWDLLLGFVQATVDFAKENRAMKAPLCGDTNHQGWNGCLPECRSSHLIFGRFNGENDLLIPQNHVILGYLFSDNRISFREIPRVILPNMCLRVLDQECKFKRTNKNPNRLLLKPTNLTYEPQNFHCFLDSKELGRVHLPWANGKNCPNNPT